MKKIITLDVVNKISSAEKSKEKKIVLVGGCFDILHPGHIAFLSEAKKSGDLLFTFLESDLKIKKMKGEGRPINNQIIRAKVLNSLPMIDYIIPLKGVTKNEEYDKLIVQIKPDFIAITENDSGTNKRRKQAEMVGAKLIVIKKMKTPSTSELIENYG